MPIRVGKSRDGVIVSIGQVSLWSLRSHYLQKLPI